MSSSLAALLLSLVAPAQAAPEAYAGVDWVPFGRADLVYVDEDRSSGTLASETDGSLRPPLRAWGGVVFGRHGVLANASIMQITTTTWASTPAEGDDGEGELVAKVRQGALRLGADYRFWLIPRQTGKPIAWVGGGAYGVVPRIDYSAEGWDESEQFAYDEAAREDKARIGGFGFTLGTGAELMWDNGLVLGARTGLQLHRGQRVDEDQISVTVQLGVETALSLGFAF